MKKKIYFIVLAILVIINMFNVPGSTEGATEIDTGDTAWMLVSAALVLLMTPGLAFFYGGMVNKKNIISTMLQSFVALGVVSILWVTVGFSLAFGESIGGVIGNPMTYFNFNGVSLAPNPDFSETIPFLLFALFQLKFAIITPALITGSFAERVRFRSYILFMVIFVLFIYTPLAHMTWHPDGLLRNWDVLDFAGGTVVHMSAGFAALAGAVYLGKRKRNVHNPSQVPYNKGAVGLGIARGAMDEFIKLATHKTPWGSGTLLKDQPEAYIRIGEAEATYQAARAFLIDSQERIEEYLGPLNGGHSEPSVELAQLGLLSSTHAAQAMRHVVDLIHNTAGTTASRMGNSLERKLRDAHQAAAHGGISWRNYGNVGKTLLGEEPPQLLTKVKRA